MFLAELFEHENKNMMFFWWQIDELVGSFVVLIVLFSFYTSLAIALRVLELRSHLNRSLTSSSDIGIISESSPGLSTAAMTSLLRLSPAMPSVLGTQSTSFLSAVISLLATREQQNEYQQTENQL